MFPELKTDRLTLRKFRDDDLEPMCTYLGNYEVSKMLTVVPYPYTSADGEWWLNHCKEAPLTEETIWAIETEHGLSGTISIRIPDDGHPRIGYWLAEPFWGKGYMSEAAEAVVNYCFEALGASKVTSGAFEENDGSLNVLAKNGFQTTGSKPEESLARGNETLTLIDVELTRDLWEAMRALTV
ncbi:putative succinyl-CoA transferase [Pseudovibrio axinellae]|uniref:Putative succinyl-CoA transferase n=1 Tax=Pseudovibrio axinellae TaxID=989403 RepID=A0A165YY50_9HYPH|nr:GNAT family N-acetyltransferase [Pseudovibrio axinellae]KZL19339.1 putative succinyl-CoA transferase [Pseudovibrio axinellae]SEQ40676.1 Protein N-acetyltransferase, RimJ/RimL family [Pseudovibrio axinellae]